MTCSSEQRVPRVRSISTRIQKMILRWKLKNYEKHEDKHFLIRICMWMKIIQKSWTCMYSISTSYRENWSTNNLLESAIILYFSYWQSQSKFKTVKIWMFLTGNNNPLKVEFWKHKKLVCTKIQLSFFLAKIFIHRQQNAIGHRSHFYI